MDEVGPATLIAALGGVLLLLAAFAEQFGWLGETIALLATLGGVFLVWTGISLAIWRAMAAWRRSIDPKEHRPFRHTLNGRSCIAGTYLAAGNV